MGYLNRLNGQINRTEAVEWVKTKLGIDNCLFVKHPARAVGETLRANIRAQEHAINATVSAIEAWEFSRGSANAAPLVLALTGPTGAGKTESGNLLSEALFARKDSVGGRLQSQGLIIFRGEEFKDNVAKPLTRYHEQIKARLAAHLKHCSERAVVVFDEVQKVIPGTLDVLMEAMSDRPMLTYFTANGVQEKYDTSQVIFVLISDIGVDSMLRLMLQSGSSRSAVEQHKLRAVVKTALDQQWDRLHFGKAISEVIPFLPFEPHDIEQIVALKFGQLGREHRGQFWRELRGSAPLFRHLAGMKYIRYTTHSLPGGRKRAFSKYGARNVVNGGPLQRLKARLFRLLDLTKDERGKQWAAKPDAIVEVLYHASTSEVEIAICDGGVNDAHAGGDQNAGDSKSEAHSDPDVGSSGSAGSTEQTCVSKWRGKLFSNA